MLTARSHPGPIIDVMSKTSEHALTGNRQQRDYRAPLPARLLVGLMCAFLAFCTGIGPLYRAQGSISDFGILNALIIIVAFAAYYALVRTCAHSMRTHEVPRLLTALRARYLAHHSKIKSFAQRCGSTRAGKWARKAAHKTYLWAVVHINPVSSSRRNLFLFFIVGWAWVPVLLNVSFGADIMGQSNEVENWLYQLTTGISPRKTLFTQTDVYPIAHYLWPSTATALTNQHNVALTLLYGLVLHGSKQLLDTMAPGVLLLSLAQYAFAAFCTAATAYRFFTLHKYRVADDGTSGIGAGVDADASTGASKKIRIITLAILLVSPMVSLSTISLTKSPLFGFASVWWIGVLYEALVHKKLSRASKWELALSGLVMLLSAKYALYVLAAQIVVLLIAAHKQWKTWLVCIALPVLAFQFGLQTLVSSGAIMDGDSIESKALQVQQIARVAKYSPQSISEDAREKLEPIFDLDTMADLYFQSDADPVKSSGALGKEVSYKWQTVTAADWKQFNSAWLEIGKAAPKEYLDAFFAEFYGYFDVTDNPYVPMLYYSDTVTVTEIFGRGYTDFAPRAAFLGFLRGWSEVPILGWFFHGNFWVVLTLLILSAQVLNRRYKPLLWQLPLLVQMAVMVAAPANNFDRHMIGVAVMAAFVIFHAATSSKVTFGTSTER